MPCLWIVLTVVAFVVPIAVTVAYAKPPRWMRARRQLDDMFVAARAEQARVLEEMLAEREQRWPR